MAQEEGRPRTMSGAQEVVLRYMRDLPPGRLLDMPAGAGSFAQRMAQAGFQVRCCDVDPGLFRAEGLSCERVDLNRDPLPYPSATFDVVASIGGLHRLYNPGHAIREAERVLLPGGRLVLGLMNYSSLKRRLLFLLYGFHAANVAAPRYVQTTDAPEANLRVPLTVPHVFQLLREVGLEVEKVEADEVARSSLFLLPLLPFLILAGRIGRRRFGDRLDLRGTDRWGILMGRRYLLVTARKAKSAVPASPARPTSEAPRRPAPVG